MECPNCGKDVDNLELHNSQFHDALEIYASNESFIKVNGANNENDISLINNLTTKYGGHASGASDSDVVGIWDVSDINSMIQELRGLGFNVSEAEEVKASEGRSKKEIQKEIDKLQNFINVASFENPLNVGADKEKLSALQVEWANATEGDGSVIPKDERNLNVQTIDDDEYTAGYREDLYGKHEDEAEEMEHQEDKPEMTQKDWDKELTGLKDDYATEDDEEDQKEVEDFVDKSIKDIYDNEMPEKPSATEEDPRCENCGDLEDLNDDGLCDYCHQEAGVDRKESERDAYEVKTPEEMITPEIQEELEGDITEERREALQKELSYGTGELIRGEADTETSDDGTDVNTPAIPDVDNTDTDDTTINVRNQYPAEFSTETWDRTVTFNTKVQAFEGIGLTQGDALKLSELNWRELSIEVRGALNEFADDEKEEKRKEIQDTFNDEGAGVGADQPDTTIEDLDEIDYNIIGDNPVAVEKYECEHCNSGFKSNEALMIHYNDIHVPAREFMLDVPNTCTYCGQEIPANVSMGEHLAYEHGISLDVKLENGQVEDGFEGGQGSGPKPAYSPTPEARGRLDIDPDYNPYAPDRDPIGDPSKAKLTEIKKKKIKGTEVIATEDGGYANFGDKPNENSWSVLTVGADLWYFNSEQEARDYVKNFPPDTYQINPPKAGESWKPHVYKATEAVSYEEEDDIDLNTPEGRDVINDLNKPYDLVPRIKEPWETEREGDPSIGEADFKEDEHPREDSGKFTSGGGGATKQKDKPKPTKNLNKVKDKILKHMGEPKDDYDRNKYNMVKNLDGYPQHSSQLRSVGVRYKAPIMKAHLQDVYPESKWSVKTQYYSGGSSINAGWAGGGPYPYGASSIKELYSDSGATDLQTDYFDVDNYVDLYDHREDKPEFDHGQHIYKDRAERFSDWTRIHLDQKSEYEASNTWSKRIAEDFTKGDVTGYQGISDETMKGLKELYGKFQDQEKKEGGGAEPKEVPKSTTPASYMKPTSQQRADEPHEFPIDPETGEDLPVSAYNPNAAKYRKPDPEDTEKDVTKARGLMKGQKGQTDEQPWQKGGESYAKEVEHEKCPHCNFETSWKEGDEWQKEDAKTEMNNHVVTHGTEGLGQDVSDNWDFGINKQEILDRAGVDDKWADYAWYELPKIIQDQILNNAKSYESYAKEDYIPAPYDKHFKWEASMDQDDYICKHCGEMMMTRDGSNALHTAPVSEIIEVVKQHLLTHNIVESYATETTIDKCIHCGRTADNHANPNTDYRGLHGDAPATDHYYEALDDGVESYAREYQVLCEHCGNTFDLKPDLKCEYCGKVNSIYANTSEAMYGYGSATGRMSPRDAWEQGASSEAGLNPVFQEFRTMHWSELPADIQELWKSELEYLTVGEVKATEDDPDFENDPDYQGFVGGKKKESSQYTQQGITDAMADPDYDKLDEVKANEVDLESLTKEEALQLHAEMNAKYSSGEDWTSEDEDLYDKLGELFLRKF